MKAGDAFWWKNFGSDVLHLWVVAFVAPNGSVLIFNITTNCPDQTCAVRAADYPAAVTHPSYVFYRRGYFFPKERADECVETGYWKLIDPPVCEAVLARIRQGAADSPDTKEAFKEILLTEGVRSKSGAVVVVRPRKRKPTP